MPPTLVIAGNGPAGQRLCERLTRADRRSLRRIVVFGEEPRPAYDRVHLSDALAGRPVAELELASLRWYRDREIELHLADPIVRIDPAKRCVESREGRALAFDALVLATGSAPVVPPVPGVETSGALVYRTADDVGEILRRARAARDRGAPVAILGGGLLGIELARALQIFGCRVEIFERAAHLLPRQLDAAAARALERQVRALGVGLTLACQVDALEPAPAGARLLVRGAGVRDFALVVVAAGVRPRDELAREAGIACHARGGILVDDRLETSEPGIHAIGECARHQGVVYGLASPCLAMADALADGLCGGSGRFRRVAPATRLKADGVDVSVAGATRLDGYGIARVTHEQGDAHRSLVLFEGRVVGAVAVGAWPEWHRVQEALSRRRLLMPWQRRRLARTGLAWGEGAGVSIERWPDAAIVCTCMGVDCGALRAARAEGCATADALALRTGASGACGTCRPLLEAFAGERADAVRAGAGRALLPAGAAAALLVGALLLLPPVPFADSVQDAVAGIPVDALWRSELARQVTGFTALGACLASLLFSLRKRWPRLGSFSYTRWRGAHAILGVAALAGVAVHTGMRLGSALDRALVLCFLALAALGAVAGIVTALEPRLSPAAGAQLRRASTAVHTLAFWPFPVLVLFHVLKTYWY